MHSSGRKGWWGPQGARNDADRNKPRSGSPVTLMPLPQQVPGSGGSTTASGGGMV